MSKDKIKVIPTAVDKLAGDVEAMKRSLPLYLEYIDTKAEIQRAHYLALIKKGFTVDEAMYIVAHSAVDE